MVATDDALGGEGSGEEARSSSVAPVMTAWYSCTSVDSASIRALRAARRSSRVRSCVMLAGAALVRVVRLGGISHRYLLSELMVNGWEELNGSVEWEPVERLAPAPG